MNTLFEILSQDKNNHQKIVEMLVEVLYGCGFLRSPLPRKYLLSYFTVKRALGFSQDPLAEGQDSKINDPQNDMVMLVEFSGMLCEKMYFNEIMKTLVNELVRQLERDLDNCPPNYPFAQVLKAITLFLQEKERWGDLATFMSSRIRKKLLKNQALLAYRWAKILEAGKCTKQQSLASWIEFLRHARESDLLDGALTAEGLLRVGDTFKALRRPMVALEVYRVLPKYDTHSQVIEIYEKEKKLVPKLLRFLT